MMLPGKCIVVVLMNSHFETVADDVMSIYERITGEPLDLTLPKEE